MEGSNVLQSRTHGDELVPVQAPLTEGLQVGARAPGCSGGRHWRHSPKRGRHRLLTGFILPTGQATSTFRNKPASAARGTCSRSYVARGISRFAPRSRTRGTGMGSF